MTTFAERPALTLPTQDVQPTRKGNAFVKWVTTTDHKRIGYLYLFTTFAWFLIAGLQQHDCSVHCKNLVVLLVTQELQTRTC